jgi:hypothetical protein
MVGAGAIVGAPALRSATVGAGVGGRGAPPAAVAVGAPPDETSLPVGGPVSLPDGAADTEADGTAGGVSTPCKLTRMVSFLSGTLDVCLDGAVDSFS